MIKVIRSLIHTFCFSRSEIFCRQKTWRTNTFNIVINIACYGSIATRLALLWKTYLLICGPLNLIPPYFYIFFIPRKQTAIKKCRPLKDTNKEFNECNMYAKKCFHLMKLKWSMSAQCLIVLDINNNNGDSLNLNETKKTVWVYYW